MVLPSTTAHISRRSQNGTLPPTLPSAIRARSNRICAKYSCIIVRPCTVSERPRKYLLDLIFILPAHAATRAWLWRHAGVQINIYPAIDQAQLYLA